MSSREEPVPHTKLSNRRRTLGLMIYAINFPLVLWKLSQFYSNWQRGITLSSTDLLFDLILLASVLGVIVVLPNWTPVFTSKYWLTREGVKITRLLRKGLTIPYKAIARAEIYIKNKKAGEVSKEAIQYAKDSANTLRRSGFKFQDYTNDDDAIILLIGESRVFLLSPSYPKAFAQKLRKRVGQLPIKVVELTSKGKRERSM